MGEKQPVVQCDQKNLKELIACLQPNRRVEVEVKGEATKQSPRTAAWKAPPRRGFFCRSPSG